MTLPRSVTLRLQYVLLHHEDLVQDPSPRACKWLRCIESARRSLSPTKQQFFDLYFLHNRPVEEVMEQLFIEHSACYAWRAEILYAIALRAVAQGLIKIKE